MKIELCKLGVVLMLGVTSMSFNVNAFQECDDPKTLGEVPSPFSISALRVELADGETYPLIGVLKFSKAGSVHFEIDFFEQPWLASQARVANPEYLVQPNRYLVAAKESAVKRVRIMMKAERVVNEFGKTHIRLTPMDFPIEEPLIKSKRAKMYCEKLDAAKK